MMTLSIRVSAVSVYSPRMRVRSWLAAIVVVSATRVLAQDAEDELPPPPPPAYQESVPPAPGAGASATPGAAAPTHAPGSPAQMQPASSAAPTTATTAAAEATPKESGARTHDGLHLRLGLGFGGLTDTITLDWPVGITTVEIDGKASGGSLAFHLGIGGEVAEGLTLGGYLLTESVTDPAIEFEGTQVTDTVDVGTLAMLGVFIDYYTNVHKGFHLGGGLGAATLKTTDTSGNTSEADQQPGGGGAMFLIGYDWWIGDQWSMGILGRITGAGLRGDHIRHDLGALSILFSVAYD